MWGMCVVFGFKIKNRLFLRYFLCVVISAATTLIVCNYANADHCRRTGNGDVKCASPPVSSIRPVARPTVSSSGSVSTSLVPVPRPRPILPTSNPIDDHFQRNVIIDTNSVPGRKIAEAAYETLGYSTVASDTAGGRKGCAVAVSKILENAGYPVGRIPGTWTLAEKLESTGCYDKLMHGENLDMSLKPGDVLITPASSKRAGHTGVYVGNGQIISNTSQGFEGSEPGTVQNNYTTEKWNEKVIPRNKAHSAVYRRKESCA